MEPGPPWKGWGSGEGRDVEPLIPQGGAVGIKAANVALENRRLH